MTTPSDKVNGTTNQVVYLTEVAETLREDALAKTREKLAYYARNLPLPKLLERADFWDYFKYQLAGGIVDTLAANDQRVQAAYVYDPSASPEGTAALDAPLDVAVHLIVRVSASSAALESFIASLDRALTASLQELPTDLFAERESVLDIVTISEEDVALRRGYAALITSVFAPPIKVWER